MSGGPMIKICGITNEADALLAVGLGATALGFNFAVSKRHVDVPEAASIISRLPDGVQNIGVFRDQPLLEVIETAAELRLDGVQLHGAESRDDASFIASQVGYVIKVFVAGDRDVVDFAAFGARHFMVDGADPGSGELFDWSVVEGVVDPAKMIVAGGLNPDNVAEAIRRLRPYGVDVASGVEAAPGIKDPLKLRSFISAARAAFGEVAPSFSGDAPFDWSE